MITFENGLDIRTRQQPAPTIARFRVRALCASIKAKGKGRKFKPEREQLKMARQYPTRAESTGEYVRQFEMLNGKIMPSCVARFAPLNDRPTTQYDPTQPVVEEALT